MIPQYFFKIFMVYLYITFYKAGDIIPNFKTHITAGVLLYPLYFLLFIVIYRFFNGNYYYFSNYEIAAGLGIFMLSSDLPDVDHDFSIINKIFRLLIFCFSVYYTLFLWNKFGFSISDNYLFFKPLLIFAGILIGFLLGLLFNSLTKHRGIWHTYIMGVILSLIFYLMFLHIGSVIRLFYSLAVFSGYSVHLILDKFFTEKNGFIKIKK
ncbi:MAG TPA: metal-dependent hydrolase [Tepiditoga sp.]|nr:metal-dependent hydrolase [Tepiditoga sp.]